MPSFSKTGRDYKKIVPPLQRGPGAKSKVTVSYDLNATPAGGGKLENARFIRQSR